MAFTTDALRTHLPDRASAPSRAMPGEKTLNNSVDSVISVVSTSAAHSFGRSHSECVLILDSTCT
jgi:hypothetical protein